jgi:hypothetical protein
MPLGAFSILLTLSVSVRGQRSSAIKMQPSRHRDCSQDCMPRMPERCNPQAISSPRKYFVEAVVLCHRDGATAAEAAEGMLTDELF